MKRFLERDVTTWNGCRVAVSLSFGRSEIDGIDCTLHLYVLTCNGKIQFENVKLFSSHRHTMSHDKSSALAKSRQAGRSLGRSSPEGAR